MQKLKTLMNLQCKCVRLDTPKIGPIWGVFGRRIIKSILKIFEFEKNDNVLLSEIQFQREARRCFFQIQKF